MPSDRKSIPTGGATMQLDAIADDLEEVAVPDLGPSMPAPPPLPPKKASTSVWIIGALVVLLATGLGLGVGLYVLNSSTPETPTAAAPPAEPEAPVEPEEAAEPEATDDGTHNVVSLDDVVFDGTEEPAEEEAAPSE